MKAKPKLLGLLAVAALLGAGGVHLYLSRHALERAGGAATSVLVLTRDVPRGEVVAREALDYRELPERYVEERHIGEHDLERVVGARAVSALTSGSTLLWSDLDTALDDGSLSALVRAGKRAFTLPDRDVGFDGQLRAGDRVDVLFTCAELGTRTLLQNVLVLAAGGELGSAVGRVTEGREVGRVTLSVGLAEAQRLALSEGRGVLRLALRNPQDLALLDAPPPATDNDLWPLDEGESLTARTERGQP